MHDGLPNVTWEVCLMPLGHDGLKMQKARQRSNVDIPVSPVEGIALPLLSSESVQAGAGWAPVQ